MHNPTIFLDIDGTILNHVGSPFDIMKGEQRVLDGVVDKLNEWEGKGYKIILTTGRKESMRRVTESVLDRCGIFYDVLIMGLGGGPRYLINDEKPDGRLTAHAINVKRDGGLSHVIIE